MALVIFMSYGMHNKTKKEQQHERRRLKNKIRKLFLNPDNEDRYYEIWERRHVCIGAYRWPGPVSNMIRMYGLDPVVHIIDNSKCEAPRGSGRLYYLGEAIKKLDSVDAVIFADDWSDHKGCVVERTVAEAYGIPIIE